MTAEQVKRRRKKGNNVSLRISRCDHHSYQGICPREGQMKLHVVADQAVYPMCFMVRVMVYVCFQLQTGRHFSALRPSCMLKLSVIMCSCVHVFKSDVHSRCCHAGLPATSLQSSQQRTSSGMAQKTVTVEHATPSQWMALLR